MLKVMIQTEYEAKNASFVGRFLHFKG